MSLREAIFTDKEWEKVVQESRDYLKDLYIDGKKVTFVELSSRGKVNFSDMDDDDSVMIAAQLQSWGKKKQ
jgi:hypothetical protein